MKKLIILISIFLLTGCYDYIEIDDLAIISGIVLDYQNDKYNLTSQIIENDKETKIKTITTEGNTIEECIYLCDDTSEGAVCRVLRYRIYQRL